VGWIGVTRPAAAGVGVSWCDVAFHYLGGKGTKTSGVDIRISWEGWFECAVRVSKNSVTFVRENIYTSQAPIRIQSKNSCQQ